MGRGGREREHEPEADRLRAALAATGVAVWTWDVPGDAISWSDGAADLFGLPAASPPGSLAALLALVDVADRDRVAEAVDAAVASGTGFAVEFRVQHPSGLRWLLLRGRVEAGEDGRPALARGIVADISGRKRDDETLRLNEERQRFLATASAALAAAPDYGTAMEELARLIVPAIADACVVDVLEPGGVIRPLASAASPATQAILDELRRRYPATLDRPQGVARVIRTGQPSFVPAIRDERRAELAGDEEHLRLLRELGTRSNITVALVARGEILGALTLKRIQSDVPYSDADLAFAEELARRAALALDNARLLREARAAVRLRDEFLSSASHDLKNPLTTIQGRVQLLQRRGGRDRAGDGEALAHGLAEIAAATRKLQTMIDELQDVSSLQIGRPLTLRRRPTDLVGLAREEVEQAQRIAPAHTLRLDADRPFLLAEVDPARLHRVLDNLLGNAIKYSPAGGKVVVGLRREEPDADGTAWAVLSVRDEGVGIPAADRPHLFERFYRGSNVAGRIAGTGIGLAGVRQIVAQHGGTIAVESEEGRGSTFTVRLPLAAVERETDGRTAAARPGPAAPQSTGVQP